MSIDRIDRLIPTPYLKTFLRAALDEMGSYTLQMMFRQAEIEPIEVDQITTGNIREVKASDFASLQASVREYYGQGARGLLTRIGQTSWYKATYQSLPGLRLWRMWSKILPRDERMKQILERLAILMRGKDGRVAVHLLDVDLYLVDHSSDATFHQAANEPICWVTLGMIQGAVVWATGKEFDVEEISCRAMGVESCRFRLR